MDCASFENELTRLLADGPDEGERTGRLRALREHVARCPDCDASRDLLELWELPAAERDLADDPGADYWNGFEDRVRERIAREGAPTARPSRWWFAAAALLVVAAGVWSVLRLPTDLGRIADAGPGTAAPPVVEQPATLPEPLEEQLAAAAPGDVLEQVEDLARWGGGWEVEPAADETDVWDEGGLFPDVDNLDGEARQALLNWLKEQTT